MYAEGDFVTKRNFEAIVLRERVDVVFWSMPTIQKEVIQR